MKKISHLQYMRKLVDISYEYNIPAVITNMIRNAQDQTFENMRAATSPFTHVKVHLLGAPASNVPRRGTVETINGRYEFEYGISICFCTEFLMQEGDNPNLFLPN